MYEIIVCDERRPGIEVLSLRGGPGYECEELQLENGLGNGLRFLVSDGDTDAGEPEFLAHFHIHSPETARLIAARLHEWCERWPDGTPRPE